MHPFVVDRYLCGWRVRSAVPLDALVSWSGDDREPDISVVMEPFPADLKDALHTGPFLVVGPDGTCHLTIPEVARYRVKAGRSVLIDPLGPANSPDIAIFLLGSVLGILCHQRGLLPMHASAVRIGSKTVAFAGASGAGKSTLAATLARRGNFLVSDDIVVIDPLASGGPIVLPSFPRLKLWKDSLKALGVADDALTHVRASIEKFLLSAPNFDPAPVKLSAVYGLSRARGPFRPGVVLMSGRHATAMLSSNIYRSMVGRLIGNQAKMFGGIVRLAGDASIWALTREDNFLELDTFAKRVEDHVHSL